MYMISRIVNIVTRTTIKHHKTAVCSHPCTVTSLNFVSTVMLWYCPHPYSTIFCTAVAVYSTVVSPSHHILKFQHHIMILLQVHLLFKG